MYTPTPPSSPKSSATNTFLNSSTSEFLGKLNFYLEALDREVKKSHENSSIGVLLCTSNDREVVEFALSRSISPTLIAEYETRLLNKDLLRQLLREWTEKITSAETVSAS